MNASKKLIIGGAIAGGLMLGAAGLVIGAGLAHADPTVTVPTTTVTAPAPARPSVRGAICDSLGIARIDRGPFGNPCPAGA